jgi:hypothetical protein
MALSNTYNFSVVRDDIIREAMLNIGAIGEAEVATAQEVSDCARKLNMLSKQWMGRQDFAPGLKMWTRQRADLFLSSTNNTYYLGPNGIIANANNWAAGVAAIPGANYGQDQTIATTAAGSAVLTVGVGSTGNYTTGDYIVVQVTAASSGLIDIFSSTIASINAGAGTVTMNAVIPTGFSVGVNAYIWNYTTLGQRPLEIATCILRDINNNDTPIDTMTLMEYEQLPSKNQVQNTADPTKIYYESQFASGTNPSGPGVLYIDCYGAQDVTKHLHIVSLWPVMDFNNPGDNPHYPQQWFRALSWGLAKDIAPMFDATWGKTEDDNFKDALAMAREPDSETSPLFFTVNER